jgi:hypothetical protein
MEGGEGALDPVVRAALAEMAAELSASVSDAVQAAVLGRPAAVSAAPSSAAGAPTEAPPLPAQAAGATGGADTDAAEAAQPPALPAVDDPAPISATAVVDDAAAATASTSALPDDTAAAAAVVVDDAVVAAAAAPAASTDDTAAAAAAAADSPSTPPEDTAAVVSSPSQPQPAAVVVPTSDGVSSPPPPPPGAAAAAAPPSLSLPPVEHVSPPSHDASPPPMGLPAFSSPLEVAADAMPAVAADATPLEAVRAASHPPPPAPTAVAAAAAAPAARFPGLGVLSEAAAAEEEEEEGEGVDAELAAAAAAAAPAASCPPSRTASPPMLLVTASRAGSPSVAAAADERPSGSAAAAPPQHQQPSPVASRPGTPQQQQRRRAHAASAADGTPGGRRSEVPGAASGGAQGSGSSSDSSSGGSGGSGGGRHALDTSISDMVRAMALLTDGIKWRDKSISGAAAAVAAASSSSSSSSSSLRFGPPPADGEPAAPTRIFASPARGGALVTRGASPVGGFAGKDAGAAASVSPSSTTPAPLTLPGDAEGEPAAAAGGGAPPPRPASALSARAALDEAVAAYESSLGGERVPSSLAPSPVNASAPEGAPASALLSYSPVYSSSSGSAPAADGQRVAAPLARRRSDIELSVAPMEGAPLLHNPRFKDIAAAVSALDAFSESLLHRPSSTPFEAYVAVHSDLLGKGATGGAFLPVADDRELMQQAPQGREGGAATATPHSKPRAALPPTRSVHFAPPQASSEVGDAATAAMQSAASATATGGNTDAAAADPPELLAPLPTVSLDAEEGTGGIDPLLSPSWEGAAVVAVADDYDDSEEEGEAEAEGARASRGATRSAQQAQAGPTGGSAPPPAPPSSSSSSSSSSDLLESNKGALLRAELHNVIFSLDSVLAAGKLTSRDPHEVRPARSARDVLDGLTRTMSGYHPTLSGVRGTPVGIFGSEDTEAGRNTLGPRAGEELLAHAVSLLQDRDWVEAPAGSSYHRGGGGSGGGGSAAAEGASRRLRSFTEAAGLHGRGSSFTIRRTGADDGSATPAAAPAAAAVAAADGASEPRPADGGAGGHLLARGLVPSLVASDLGLLLEAAGTDSSYSAITGAMSALAGGHAAAVRSRVPIPRVDGSHTSRSARRREPLSALLSRTKSAVLGGGGGGVAGSSPAEAARDEAFLFPASNAPYLSGPLSPSAVASYYDGTGVPPLPPQSAARSADVISAVVAAAAAVATESRGTPPSTAGGRPPWSQPPHDEAPATTEWPSPQWLRQLPPPQLLCCMLRSHATTTGAPAPAVPAWSLPACLAVLLQYAVRGQSESAAHFLHAMLHRRLLDGAAPGTVGAAASCVIVACCRAGRVKEAEEVYFRALASAGLQHAPIDSAVAAHLAGAPPSCLPQPMPASPTLALLQGYAEAGLYERSQGLLQALMAQAAEAGRKEEEEEAAAAGQEGGSLPSSSFAAAVGCTRLLGAAHLSAAIEAAGAAGELEPGWDLARSAALTALETHRSLSSALASPVAAAAVLQPPTVGDGLAQRAAGGGAHVLTFAGATPDAAPAPVVVVPLDAGVMCALLVACGRAKAPAKARTLFEHLVAGDALHAQVLARAAANLETQRQVATDESERLRAWREQQGAAAEALRAAAAARASALSTSSPSTRLGPVALAMSQAGGIFAAPSPPASRPATSAQSSSADVPAPPQTQLIPAPPPALSHTIASLAMLRGSSLTLRPPNTPSPFDYRAAAAPASITSGEAAADASFVSPLLAAAMAAQPADHACTSDTDGHSPLAPSESTLYSLLLELRDSGRNVHPRCPLAATAATYAALVRAYADAGCIDDALAALALLQARLQLAPVEAEEVGESPAGGSLASGSGVAAAASLYRGAVESVLLAVPAELAGQPRAGASLDRGAIERAVKTAQHLVSFLSHAATDPSGPAVGEGAALPAVHVSPRAVLAGLRLCWALESFDTAHTLFEVAQDSDACVDDAGLWEEMLARQVARCARLGLPATAPVASALLEAGSSTVRLQLGRRVLSSLVAASVAAGDAASLRRVAAQMAAAGVQPCEEGYAALTGAAAQTASPPTPPPSRGGMLHACAELAAEWVRGDALQLHRRASVAGHLVQLFAGCDRIDDASSLLRSVVLHSPHMHRHGPLFAAAHCSLVRAHTRSACAPGAAASDAVFAVLSATAQLLECFSYNDVIVGCLHSAAGEQAATRLPRVLLHEAALEAAICPRARDPSPLLDGGAGAASADVLAQLLATGTAVIDACVTVVQSVSNARALAGGRVGVDADRARELEIERVSRAGSDVYSTLADAHLSFPSASAALVTRRCAAVTAILDEDGSGGGSGSSSAGRAAEGIVGAFAIADAAAHAAQPLWAWLRLATDALAACGDRLMPVFAGTTGGSAGGDLLGVALGAVSAAAQSGGVPTPQAAAFIAGVATRCGKPQAVEAAIAAVAASATAALQRQFSVLRGQAAAGDDTPSHGRWARAVEAYLELLTCSDEGVVAARLHAAACTASWPNVQAVWAAYHAAKTRQLTLHGLLQPAATTAAPGTGARAQTPFSRIYASSSSTGGGRAPPVDVTSPAQLIPCAVAASYIHALVAVTSSPVVATSVQTFAVRTGATVAVMAAGGSPHAVAPFAIREELSPVRGLTAVCDVVRAMLDARVVPDVHVLTAVATALAHVGLVAHARLLLRQVLAQLRGCDFTHDDLAASVERDTRALAAEVAVGRAAGGPGAPQQQPAAAAPALAAVRPTASDRALVDAEPLTAPLDASDAALLQELLLAASSLSSTSRTAPAAPAANVPVLEWASLCALLLAMGRAGCRPAEVSQLLAVAAEQQREAQGASAYQQRARLPAPELSAQPSAPGAAARPLLDRAAALCAYAAYVCASDVDAAEGVLVDSRFSLLLPSPPPPSAASAPGPLAQLPATSYLHPAQFAASVASLRVVGLVAVGRVHDALRQLELIVTAEADARAFNGAHGSSSTRLCGVHHTAVTAVLEAASSLTRAQLCAVPACDAPISAATADYLLARALRGEDVGYDVATLRSAVATAAAAAAAGVGVATTEPPAAGGGADAPSVAQHPFQRDARACGRSLTASPAASVMERLEALAELLTGGGPAAASHDVSSSAAPFTPPPGATAASSSDGEATTTTAARTAKAAALRQAARTTARGQRGATGASAADAEAEASELLLGPPAHAGGASAADLPPLWLPAPDDVAALSRLYARLGRPHTAASFVWSALDELHATETVRQLAVARDEASVRRGGDGGADADEASVLRRRLAAALDRATRAAQRGPQQQHDTAADALLLGGTPRAALMAGAATAAAVAGCPGDATHGGWAATLSRWGMRPACTTATDAAVRLERVAHAWHRHGGHLLVASAPAAVPLGHLLQCLAWAYGCAPTAAFACGSVSAHALGALETATRQLSLDPVVLVDGEFGPLAPLLWALRARLADAGDTARVLPRGALQSYPPDDEELQQPLQPASVFSPHAAEVDAAGPPPTFWAGSAAAPTTAPPASQVHPAATRSIDTESVASSVSYCTDAGRALLDGDVETPPFTSDQEQGGAVDEPPTALDALLRRRGVRWGVLTACPATVVHRLGLPLLPLHATAPQQPAHAAGEAPGTLRAPAMWQPSPLSAARDRLSAHRSPPGSHHEALQLAAPSLAALLRCTTHGATATGSLVGWAQLTLHSAAARVRQLPVRPRAFLAPGARLLLALAATRCRGRVTASEAVQALAEAGVRVGGGVAATTAARRQPPLDKGAVPAPPTAREHLSTLRAAMAMTAGTPSASIQGAADDPAAHQPFTGWPPLASLDRTTATWAPPPASETLAGKRGARAAPASSHPSSSLMGGGDDDQPSPPLHIAGTEGDVQRLAAEVTVMSMELRELEAQSAAVLAEIRQLEAAHGLPAGLAPAGSPDDDRREEAPEAPGDDRDSLGGGGGGGDHHPSHAETRSGADSTAHHPAAADAPSGRLGSPPAMLSATTTSLFVDLAELETLGPDAVVARMHAADAAAAGGSGTAALATAACVPEPALGTTVSLPQRGVPHDAALSALLERGALLHASLDALQQEGASAEAEVGLSESPRAAFAAFSQAQDGLRAEELALASQLHQLEARTLALEADWQGGLARFADARARVEALEREQQQQQEAEAAAAQVAAAAAAADGGGGSRSSHATTTSAAARARALAAATAALDEAAAAALDPAAAHAVLAAQGLRLLRQQRTAYAQQREAAAHAHEASLTAAIALGERRRAAVAEQRARVGGAEELLAGVEADAGALRQADASLEAAVGAVRARLDAVLAVRRRAARVLARGDEAPGVESEGGEEEEEEEEETEGDELVAGARRLRAARLACAAAAAAAQQRQHAATAAACERAVAAARAEGEAAVARVQSDCAAQLAALHAEQEAQLAGADGRLRDTFVTQLRVATDAGEAACAALQQEALALQAQIQSAERELADTGARTARLVRALAVAAAAPHVSSAGGGGGGGEQQQQLLLFGGAAAADELLQPLPSSDAAAPRAPGSASSPPPPGGEARLMAALLALLAPPSAAEAAAAAAAAAAGDEDAAGRRGGGAGGDDSDDGGGGSDGDDDGGELAAAQVVLDTLCALEAFLEADAFALPLQLLAQAPSAALAAALPPPGTVVGRLHPAGLTDALLAAYREEAVRLAAAPPVSADSAGSTSFDRQHTLLRARLGLAATPGGGGGGGGGVGATGSPRRLRLPQTPTAALAAPLPPPAGARAVGGGGGLSLRAVVDGGAGHPASAVEGGAGSAAAPPSSPSRGASSTTPTTLLVFQPSAELVEAAGRRAATRSQIAAFRAGSSPSSPGRAAVAGAGSGRAGPPATPQLHLRQPPPSPPVVAGAAGAAGASVAAASRELGGGGSKPRPGSGSGRAAAQRPGGKSALGVLGF